MRVQNLKAICQRKWVYGSNRFCELLSFRCNNLAGFETEPSWNKQSITDPLEIKFRLENIKLTILLTAVVFNVVCS